MTRKVFDSQFYCTKSSAGPKEADNPKNFGITVCRIFINPIVVGLTGDRGSECDFGRKNGKGYEPEYHAEDVESKNGPVLVDDGLAVPGNQEVDECNDCD